MSVICQIYRSQKEDGMYLFVKKEEGLSRVPDELITLFGEPTPAMVIVLSKEKKLARVTVETVIAALDSQGYYLQLPPRGEQDTEMRAMRDQNDKL